MRLFMNEEEGKARCLLVRQGGVLLYLVCRELAADDGEIIYLGMRVVNWK